MKFCQIAVSEQAWIFSATSLTELPLSCSQCYTIGCMSCHILYEYGLVARGTFQSLPSSSPLTHSLTRYILQMVLNNIFCQCGCVSQALMSCGKQDSWKCLPIAVSVFHRVKQVFVWFIREQIFFFSLYQIYTPIIVLLHFRVQKLCIKKINVSCAAWSCQYCNITCRKSSHYIAYTVLISCMNFLFHQDTWNS